MTKEWNRELVLERLALGEDSRVAFRKASFKEERIVAPRPEDTHDRTYLYAFNIAIDEGTPQPVHFRMNQPLSLTDVHGVERIVQVLEMIGHSGLLEYQTVGKR